MSSSSPHTLPIQLSTLCLGILALILTGCGAGTPASPSLTGAQLQGSVHGGQQPVTGSTIQLYAAGTSGYGTGATSLLTTPVTTDSNGFFTITGDYTCPSASSQLYIVATGGNPGLATPTNNAALVLMAALGPCTLYGSTYTLNPASFITINEVTTVASAYALSGFMDPVTTQIGTSLTNATGLANAFATVNNLVNTTTGTALSVTPVGNGTVPQTEVNTLANILSSCVNSSGSGSPCTNLFAAATPSGGTAPTNTLQAILSVALNPASQDTALVNLIPASPPFQPSSTSPSTWILGIVFPYSSSLVATSIAMDPSGNLWVGLPSSTGILLPLIEYSNTGAILAGATGYSGSALTSPHITFDPAGNLWVAATLASGGGALVEFTGNNSVATTYTTPGLTQPGAIAIDGSGNLWVTNFNGTTSSVFEFSPSGTLISPTNGYTATSLPTTNGSSLAISNSGNVWAGGSTYGTITEFNSSGQVLSGSGFGNYNAANMAFDSLGNLWTSGGSKLSSSGVSIPISPFCSPTCNTDMTALAIDGAGNAWGGVNLYSFLTFFYGISELNNSGAAVLGPNGILDGQLPNLIAVDTSGNVWAVPGLPYHQFPNPTLATYELIGAATPVVIPSIGTQNHTVGMRP